MTKFIFWMLLASALGLFKFVALAYTMPSQDYGQYVSYFGIATFASLLVSFGLTEKTVKEYPRRWVSGQHQLILKDAAIIGRMLALRFLFLGVMCLSFSFFGLISIEPIVVILAALLGLSTGLLALLASLYRAVGSKTSLKNFTLLRSTLTVGFALLAGSLLGWKGAIGGDIVGSLMVIVFAIWQIPRLYRNESPIFSTVGPTVSSENGHYQIYFANLAVAPQSMLDRAWIRNSIGPASAGSFGLIMLIPQAVQLLGNVVVQHVGPLIIKLVHLKELGADRQSTIRFNALLLAIFSIALTMAALFAKRVSYLDYLFAKFEISDISLILAGVIACGQIYGLIEFHLIARDRENEVLVASLVSGLIFIISFAAASAAQAGVEWFLAGTCLARWGQVWLLRRAYLRYA